MRTNSFVYRWTDTITGMMYIGAHKGTLDDGYVCSSKYMLKEYSMRPNTFQRQIIAEFEDYNDCRKFEIELLKLVDAKSNPQYYNRSNGTHYSCYRLGPRSKDAIEKGRQKLLGHKKTKDWVRKINNNPEKIKKTAEKHRGMKRTLESRMKMSKAKKDNFVPWNKGKSNIYSEATKKKIGDMNRNKKWCYDPQTGKNFLMYPNEIPPEYIIGMNKNGCQTSI